MAVEELPKAALPVSVTCICHGRRSRMRYLTSAKLATSALVLVNLSFL